MLNIFLKFMKLPALRYETLFQCDLWWEPLTCDIPSSCPLAQPHQFPNPHQPKQNQQEGGTAKINVNPTQLSHQMGHPVEFGLICQITGWVIGVMLLINSSLINGLVSSLHHHPGWHEDIRRPSRKQRHKRRRPRWKSSKATMPTNRKRLLKLHSSPSALSAWWEIKQSL